MNILYESMTRIQWGQITVRVWRQWEGGVIGSNLDIARVVASVDPLTGTSNDVLNKLIDLDRVNAVEVLDSSGCGTVAYKDWP